MRARSVLLRRRLASELAQGRGRALGILFVGLAVAAVVFSAGFGGGFYVVYRGAPELVRTGVSAVLLALTAALVLSSLGHAAQAFFSAKDLWFWDSTPAPVWSRFVDRMVETGIAALPTTLALGAFGLTGIVLGAGLGPLAVIRGLVAVLAIGLIPLSLGVMLAHLGGAVLPAGKLRRVSLLLLGVGVAVVLVWFRRARVEKALSPEGAAEVLASARSVQQLGPESLPSSLGASFITGGELFGLLGLLAWSSAAVGLAFLAHVVLSRRARDLAVDESPVGLLRGSLRERALTLLVRPLSPELRPMVEKDLLSFLRDPAQWGQVVLLLGVGALYLVNADALRQGFLQMPEIGAAILPAMHTGLVTFIASGLAVRFAFPQVGLEGPAVWIVDGSPMKPRSILLAKWIASLPIVVFYPCLIGAVGGFVLHLRPFLWVITTLTCAAVSAGVAAFAVGRGALKPLFDATSLSELAMGPGALSTMMISVALAFAASVGAMFAGIAVVVSEVRDLSWPNAVTIAVASCLVPSALAIFSARSALAAGAQAFVLRREDEAEREYITRHAVGPVAIDE
jgi:ABC-2 type transport system permease protein